VGVRFEVLGGVRAWRGNVEVELGSPQQRAILAILLMRVGMPVSPDQLVSAIWGETPPRAAVGMVRSYVSRLRHALDDGHSTTVIESIGGRYALQNASATLDATEFEQRINASREARHTGDHVAESAELRAGLALWKDAPLAGVRGDYAESERIRLGQLRLAAIEDLAAADLGLGRHVEAAVALAPLIDEHPLHERPRELLMLALYRSGRQADALAVYSDTRRLLADKLGIEPGPELREMQRRILASDPKLFDPEPQRVVATPAQLPPDLPDFTGRADLAAAIIDALSPSQASVPVIGLVGLAGVGKTALAVHAGHGGDFPDGRLFVDLGVTDEPLVALLHGMGVAAPDATGERVTLWRTLSAGRRLLVVLDGARDAEQVRSLLPGSGGAAVLLTARQRLFGLEHVRWLKLDGLREDESLALLERMVGPRRIVSEPAEAVRLVRLTSGLPQALRGLGARMASRPTWSLATTEKRIHTRRPEDALHRPECQVIEGPYESAMRDLTPAQTRALRLLAVPDGPDISVAAAAAVLDLPVVDTEILLESLADAHLIETGPLDRYHYLLPVHTFARRRAVMDDGQSECEIALVRLARFYAASVRNALLATDCSLDLPAVTADGMAFTTAESARTWLLMEHEHVWALSAQVTGMRAMPTDQLTALLTLVSHFYPDGFASEPLTRPESADSRSWPAGVQLAPT
jgi:DNA-binding SARP family transcriptional activator